MKIHDLSSFNAAREAGLAKLLPSKPRIAIGMGTCGSGNGAEAVYHAFADTIDSLGLGFHLTRAGCFGFCAAEPLVNVWLPGKPLVILHRVKENDAASILDELQDGRIPTGLALCKIEEWDHVTAHVKYGVGFPDVPHWHEVPFFRGQNKIVMRNCGLISPGDIEEYLAVGGYEALYKVLIDNDPQAVIEQIKASKLRGRGGGVYAEGRPAQGDRSTDAGSPGSASPSGAPRCDRLGQDLCHG